MVFRVDALETAGIPPKGWEEVAKRVRPDSGLPGRVLAETVRGRASVASLVVGGYGTTDNRYLVALRRRVERD